MGYGAAMFFYTVREWGDLGRFVFGRQWAEAGVQLKFADSWLDWTVPLIMGLMTAHLLPT